MRGSCSSDLGWCPAEPIVRLLLMHLVEDGHDPLFEFDIIGVGHEHVADPVETLHPQLSS